MRNCNMPNYNMARYDMNRHMHEHGNSCGCDRACDDYPIGMAYVPWQEFKNLHDPEQGMHAGTIFMELDKPFTGRRSFKR